MFQLFSCRSKFLVKCMALIACIGFAPLAQADLLSDVKSRGQLVCGTVETIEPMGYLDMQTRKVVGFDVDICEAVAKGLGVKFVQKSVSIEARIPELTLGRIDILSAVLGYTPERAQQIDYTASHFQVPIRIFVKTDSPYQKILDLKGRKVGMPSGTTPEYWLRRRFPDVIPVTFKDNSSAFVALQQGKVEGHGIPQTSGSRYIADGKGAYRFIEEPLGWEPNALGIRKGEPEFLAAVNKVLVQMESSGEIDRIWNKWLGMNTQYKVARDKHLTPIAEISTDLKK